MSIIQSEDLEARGLLNDQSSALQIQGKWFKPGPAFTKSLRQAAIEFCEDARCQGRQYLLVEFPTYFMAWQHLRPYTSAQPFQTQGETELSRSLQADLAVLSPHTAQRTGQHLPPRSPSTGQSEGIRANLVNRAFINQCRTELTLHVGPMATFLIQKTLKQSPQMTPQQLVESLAQQIPNEKAALLFQQALQSA
ncbi:hypothetical protein [Acaryochloris sp. IP29b_bin.148]|uniref:hypothetical protein n=1 Tax=Acaryochloris sp. IP29b_bin.148 TaxID=2969218 RepID=UPI00262CD408|nr:hypothetical protein [Acaryochloris sp. IP29b_bin.148]